MAASEGKIKAQVERVRNALRDLQAALDDVDPAVKVRLVSKVNSMQSFPAEGLKHLDVFARREVDY